METKETRTGDHALMPTPAYREAKRIFEQSPGCYPGYLFEDFLRDWAQNHYMMATPLLFALAKPINREDAPADIWSPVHRANPEKVDT